MKRINLLLCFILMACLMLCVGCTSANKASTQLSSWNQEGSVTAITAFVDDICNKESPNYVSEENRISVWDMDGTWMLESDQGNCADYVQYALYRAYAEKYRSDSETCQNWLSQANKDKELMLKGELSANASYISASSNLLHAAVDGQTPDQLREGLCSVTDTQFSMGMTCKEAAYKPMVELYHYLREHGFTIYIISGSNRYATYAAAQAVFSTETYRVPFDLCKGMSFEVTSEDKNPKNGVKFTSTAADSTVYYDKCRIIANEIGKKPILTCGNSYVDADMLDYTLSGSSKPGLAVLINHDDANRERAYGYEEMSKAAKDRNWLCVSMKNDFVDLFNK